MFKNLTIGKRLGLSFGMVIVMVIIMGVVALNSLNTLSKQTAKMYHHPYAASNTANRIDAGMVRVHRGMKDVVLADTQTEIEAAVSRLKEFEKGVYENIDLLHDRFLGDQSKVDAIARGMDSWMQFNDETIKIARAGQRIEATERVAGDGLRIQQGVSAAIREMIKEVDAKGQEFADHAMAVKQQAYYLMAAIAAAAILISIIVSVLVTRNLLRTLGGEPAYVTGIVEEISKGNLTVDVLTRTGDTSSMMISVQRMVQALREIAGQSVEAANQVSMAADQISEANQSFSQKITEQAASVEETTAAMEEMGASTRSTAENAREANNLARNSRTVVEKGTTVMTDTINAMSEINRSSSRIANISDVIGEIAFQTNLLALNAAVEAARAGEHGKGFAVVAAEIRSLAQRTTTSAKEITDLIEDSSEKTSRGVQLAEELGTQLHEIMDGINKVTDLVDEVAAASQEQSAGINQVNTAMVQVDQATQQNASLVEETSASAEELAAQARALLDVISFFRVDNSQQSRKATVRQPTASKAALPTGKQTVSHKVVANRPVIASQTTADQGDFSDF